MPMPAKRSSAWTDSRNPLGGVKIRNQPFCVESLSHGWWERLMIRRGAPMRAYLNAHRRTNVGFAQPSPNSARGRICRDPVRLGDRELQILQRRHEVNGVLGCVA